MVETFYKVAYGIKLEGRTCQFCPNTFWVPKSCTQVTCSEWCQAKIKAKTYFKTKNRTKSSWKLTKEDYE